MRGRSAGYKLKMGRKLGQGCLKCGTRESASWTNAESLGVICLNCVNEAKDDLKSDDDEEKTEEGRSSRRRTRATKSYKTRLNPFAVPKPGAPRGRGRRALFKKTPVKSPSETATPVTSENLFYNVNQILYDELIFRYYYYSHK